MPSKTKSTGQEAAVLETQADELSDLKLAESGKPVPFEAFDETWAIRQPTPMEMDMIRLQENIGHNQAMAQPGMEELKSLPVSEDVHLMREFQLQLLRMKHEQETNREIKQRLSEQMSMLEKPDTRSRAEHLADLHASRHRNRWMVEHLIVHKDGTELTKEERDGLFFPPGKAIAVYELAREACYIVLRVATSYPNLFGHTALDSA